MNEFMVAFATQTITPIAIALAFMSALRLFSKTEDSEKEIRLSFKLVSIICLSVAPIAIALSPE